MKESNINDLAGGGWGKIWDFFFLVVASPIFFLRNAFLYFFSFREKGRRIFLSMENGLRDIFPGEGPSIFFLDFLRPTPLRSLMVVPKYHNAVWSFHLFVMWLQNNNTQLYSFTATYSIPDLTTNILQKFKMTQTQVDKECTKGVHSIPLPKWAFYHFSVHCFYTFLHHSIYTLLQ